MAQGISLHIGLNSVDPKHYAGWSGPLNACEADADDMNELAKEQGFRAILLKTKQATRVAVRNGILKAAKSLDRGDFLLVTYSGHGGQVPDFDHEEPDLKDETWCLYDGELIDDELYALWAKFKDGVRILVLSDSCHSGTVTKLAIASGALNSGSLAAFGVETPVYRFMPDEVALRTFRQNRKFYEKLGKEQPSAKVAPKATVRLISGCQDNQVSLDGTFNGLFTGMLLRVWNDGKFKGDYSRFHKEIVKRMPSTQTPIHFMVGKPNAAYNSQQPFMI